MRRKYTQLDSGMALIVVLGMMLIFSLMMLGFYFMVTGEQKVAVSNRDNSVAFYAAEGGLEKMSADLADLSATSPLSVANITALDGPTYQPAITGVTYPIYSVVPATTGAALQQTNGTIGGSGPLAGLQGIITPITLTVSAESGFGNMPGGTAGTEVKLSRQVQDVAVPIFEFGIFSQTDLSFFAGPNFDFGGRVATNGNLFLAEGTGSTLKMEDKVTTAGDVIRTQLSNGWATSSNYTGTVEAIESAGGCTPSSPTNPPCRPLASTDGSLVGGPGSAVNPNWHNLSLTTYNGNIRSKSTGVKALNLSIALAGASPIDLIRRGVTGESSLISQERYYSKASLRILLSDQAALLPGNGTFDSNGKPAVVPLDNTLNSAPLATYGYAIDACHPPIAVSPGTGVDGSDFFVPQFIPSTTTPSPMIGGFIEIDMQLNATPGTWQPVTMEILNLGITGSPGSSCTLGTTTFYPIVHLEQLDNLNHIPAATPGATDYIPINMYDAREGEQRDVTSSAYTTLAMGGIMNVVELDVGNLQKWFACTYPAGVTTPATCSGTLALNTNTPDNAGYIVYFSDRRNNHNSSGAETAEYGNEDIINPAGANGCPDGVLDPSEDVNGNGVLDTYGATPNLNGSTLTAAGVTSIAGATNPCSAGVIAPEMRITLNQAAKNPVIFFRRALRVADGAVGNLPPLAASTAATCNPSGTGGFTVAAENPVYVMGDYNANTGLGAGNQFNDTAGSACHVPAAVAGDAVTLLSNNWWSSTYGGPLTYQGDYNSFASPDSANVSGSFTGRPATTTSYRIGVIGGKNISFTQPSGYTTYKDFGTDGGAHNFLRFIENWSGQTLNYRGSIISLYYARQATGVYKYTAGPYEVYGAPSRGYHFDTDFLSLTSLPPGTPRFTDVNALSFEQALLPNQ